MNPRKPAAAGTNPCGQTRPRARRLSRTFAVLLVAALSAVLAACGSSGESNNSSTSNGSAKTTLRIAVNSQTALNPAKSNYSLYWGALYSNPAYAALFHVSPEGEIEPGLATEWRFLDKKGERNKVFEFTLRDGVKFSDGEPLTAKAVVKWIKYFIEAKGLYSGVLGPDPKITATGPLTVKIELSTPNPSLATVLSDQGSLIGMIGSPKAVDDPKLLDSGTYGAGPYKLLPSETVNGDHYTFVPNEHYWDKQGIRFEKIYMKVIANPSSRLQAQQSGQYDVTIGDSSTAAEAEAAGLQVKTGPQGMLFLSLDQRHDVGAPALKNVKVRQAMNYAIDREGIVKALFGETAKPTFGFVQQDMDTAPFNFRYEYNPEKAKQLMAEAGYADGFTLNAIYPGFFGNFGTPLMNAVTENLKEIGITLNSQSYPNEPAFADEVFKYKAAVVHTLDVINVTPAIYPLYLAPTSAINFWGDDKELTRLYEEGASAEDPTEAWGRMWEHFTTQALTVPMVTYPAIYYVSDGIEGVESTTRHPSALPTEWSTGGEQ